MSAIQFVIRDGAGILQHGTVVDPQNDGSILIAQGDGVSLNLSRANVHDYVRAGDALELYLADGRRIVLENFFSGADTPNGTLYLNEGGRLLEVAFGPDGRIDFSEAATWGKWSQLEALIFPDDPVVAPYAVAEAADSAVAEALVAGGAQNEVGTQAIGIGIAQLGLGGLGGLGLGSAALGGAGLLAGGAALAALTGSGDPAAPTVDHADARFEIGSGDAKTIHITGTAEPGAVVGVRVGNEVVTVRAEDDGTWSAEFSGDDFPADGGHSVVVTVTNPDGSVTVLDGPSVRIDTVAPDVDASGNLGMSGTWINASAAQGGVTINGTGEPGAEIVVEIEGVQRSTTVGGNGRWSVEYAQGTLPGGEYTTTMTVSATDAFGNQSVIRETLSIDTVAPELGIGIIAEDGIVNAGERAGAIEISGNAEAGAGLVVTIQGQSFETTANAAGAWSVTIPAGTLPEGEYDTLVTAVATDRAGNSTTSTMTLTVDTVGAVSIAPGVNGGEAVVNEGMSGDGIELSGTTEPGSSVSVNYEGTDYDAVVDEDGNWTVTIPAGDVAEGEYEAEVIVTSTDGAGNTSSTTSTVTVDTETFVTIAAGHGGGNAAIINAGDATGGVTFSGSTEPGAEVVVSFEGTTYTTHADEHGNWSVDFAPEEIPGGQYDGTLTVTVTDLAGNSATETRIVPVDTLAAIDFEEAMVAGDNVLNAEEIRDGVVLGGTTLPGSTVTVAMGGRSYDAVVDEHGNWTVEIPSQHLPRGEMDVDFVATSVSPAGNVATSTFTLGIDTVTEASLGTVMGDNIANASEFASGIVLNGMAEPGSRVVVQVGDEMLETIAAQDGSWTVTFPPDAFPRGEYDLPVVVTSTDLAGNTARVVSTLAIDTEAPDPVYIESYTRAGDVVRQISVPIEQDVASVQGLAADGSTPEVLYNTEQSLFFPEETDISLGPVPDGTHLVVTRADAAGNTSSTLLAMDGIGVDLIDLANPGLAGVNLDALDLKIAVNSDTTISADLLESLSVNGNTLIVHGGDDDILRIDTTDGAPFEATGEVVTINADTYSVYTLGEEGGRLIIDDDINVVT